MRRIVTGIDADGRSTVFLDGTPPVGYRGGSGSTQPELITDGRHEATEPGTAVVHELWALGTQPSVTTDDPTVSLTEASWDVPPGETKWIITHMGPDLFTPMHSTPTIDYGLLVSGELEMGLEDGTSVALTSGDAIVVNGVMHSWHSGPNGCIIATVLVGLRPEER
jgi:quercetin dioxygenase-like cupin family protein